MRVLIADDQPATRVVLERFVERMGHQAIVASDGAEAIERFVAEQPHLVLMDVMMPGVDGFEATRRIRELGSRHWVPVIFLSAIQGEVEQLQGLQVGGDDYVVKPVNLGWLKAKIEALSRVAALQSKLETQNEELEAYRARSELDRLQAAAVVDALMSGQREAAADGVRLWIKPAVEISGDVVLAAVTPSGATQVMIADCTGHGLGAAISALPTASTFHAMTARGFAIPAIAREMNRKLRPLVAGTGRFVCAALITVDTRRRCVEVWNAGIPFVALLGDDGSLKHEWRSSAVPLGVLDDSQFVCRPMRCDWHDDVAVLACSDGVLEATDPDGNYLGQDRLVDLIARTPPENRLTAIRDFAERFVAGRDGHDDMSVVEVRPDPAVTRTGPAAGKQELPKHDWRFAVALGPDEIRRFDLGATLSSWLSPHGITPEHFAEIMVVIAELYENALDHGLLKLESAVKAQPDGFLRYIEARAQTLAALKSGEIALSVESLIDDGCQYVVLTVRDSGSGFDPAALPQLATTEGSVRTLPFGWGLILVRSLCANVAFLGRGNHVVARYALR